MPSVPRLLVLAAVLSAAPLRGAGPPDLPARTAEAVASDSAAESALAAWRAIEALAAAGFYDEARERYREAIQREAPPAGTAARAEIEARREALWYLAPAATPADFIRLAFTDPAAFLPRLAGWLGVPSWIGILFVVTLAGLLVNGSLARDVFDVRDFEHGAPSVSEGKSVRALLVEQLEKFETEGIRPVVHMVSGTTRSLPRPADFVPANAFLKALASAVEWLPMFRKATVYGLLHPAGSDGAGMTVTLARKGGPALTETFWQRTYHPGYRPGDASPDAWRILCAPAATWVRFEASAPAAARPWLGSLLGRAAPAGNGGFRPVGTGSWRSYAAFQAGVWWSLQGDPARARHLYLAALNEDPRNYGALLNLAVADLEDAYAGPPGPSAARRIREAAERLDRVRAMAGRREPWGWLPAAARRRPILNPSWYTATYQSGALALYEKLLGRGPAGAAAAAVAELREEMDRAARWCRARRAVRSVLAPADRVLGIFSLWRRLVSDRGLRCEKLLCFLAEIRPLADLLAWTQDGARPLPEGALARHEASSRSLVRYNVACFLAAARADYAGALRHLDFALARGGSLARWARHDPALDSLRRARPVEFRIVASRFRGKPGPLPLADIARIGPANAALLHRKAGVLEAGDLAALRDGRPPEAAARDLALVLSERDGDRRGLQRRIPAWLDLARLRLLEGMTDAWVNLLDAAGVRSPARLAAQDPRRLHRRLERCARRYGLGAPAPLPLLGAWIESARGRG